MAARASAVKLLNGSPKEAKTQLGYRERCKEAAFGCTAFGAAMPGLDKATPKLHAAFGPRLASETQADMPF